MVDLESGNNLVNFVFNQGETVQKELRWSIADVPVNLTGYTARMFLKRRLTDESPEFTLTTENGRISLGGTLGTITLNISATDSAQMFGEYIYDLELVNGSFVKRLLKGSISIDYEVTK